ALTNATLPYVIQLADAGVDAALERDPGLRLGVNVSDGRIVHPAVAQALGAEVPHREEDRPRRARAARSALSSTESRSRPTASRSRSSIPRPARRWRSRL